MPLKRDEVPGTLLRGADNVERAYREALGAEGAAPAAPDAPAAPAGGAVDASRTKAELLDDAKAADIAGRTKMSKEQLVEALEQHSRGDSA